MIKTRVGQQRSYKTLTGVFYDSPVEGLSYETQTLSGMTNDKGEFEYREGETVTFSVGGLVLGSARGSERVTPADIVLSGKRRYKKVKKPNTYQYGQILTKPGRGR